MKKFLSAVALGACLLIGGSARGDENYVTFSNTFANITALTSSITSYNPATISNGVITGVRGEVTLANTGAWNVAVYDAASNGNLIAVLRSNINITGVSSPGTLTFGSNAAPSANPNQQYFIGSLANTTTVQVIERWIRSGGKTPTFN